MYWPIGTPRIYATSSSRAPTVKLVESHDGIQSPSELEPGASPPPGGLHPAAASDGQGQDHLQPPPTPITPLTPAVQSVEHDDGTFPESHSQQQEPETSKVPVADPILALRVSRAGHLFAVITATSITVWQAKVFTSSPAFHSSSSDRHSQPPFLLSSSDPSRRSNSTARTWTSSSGQIRQF